MSAKAKVKAARMTVTDGDNVVLAAMRAVTFSQTIGDGKIAMHVDRNTVTFVASFASYGDEYPDWKQPKDDAVAGLVAMGASLEYLPAEPAVPIDQPATEDAGPELAGAE